MTYTSVQLDEAFNRLPEKLQDFILSDNAAISANMIAEAYDIPPSKQDDFYQLCFAMFVDVVSIDQFLNELQMNYNLNEIKASEILLDLDGLILEPLFYLLTTLDKSPTASINPNPSVPLNANASTPTPVRPKITLNFPDTPKVGGYNMDGPVPLMPKNRVEPNPAVAHTTPAFTSPKITRNFGSELPQASLPETHPDHLLAAHNAQGPAPIPTPHVEKPAPAPAIPQSPTSIFQAKLQGQSRIPTEEIKLEAKTRPRDGVDPYREPPTA